MPEQYELLEKYGGFLNYKYNSEVVKQGLYVLRKQRKIGKLCKEKISKETGKPPADNMTPTEKLLEYCKVE